MFCPNCGTQNPDTAQTCSKCTFHLKSAAAPKFKGTMLMMNQPNAVPTPPTPATSPVPPVRTGPGAAPPAGAMQIPSKLKGTMVGVAPMAGGVPLPPPMAPPMAPPGAPPGAMGASPAPPPYGAPPPAAPFAEGGMSAFSPPVPQAGVNPLGGTVAADAGVFAAFAAQQQAAPPFAQGGPPPYPPPAGAAHGTSPMQAAPPPPMYPPYHAPPPPPPYGGAPPGPPVPGHLPPFAAPPPPGGMGGAPPFAAPMNPQGYGADPMMGQPPPVGYGQPGMAPMPGAQGLAPMPGAQGLAPYGAPHGGMVGTLKSEAPSVIAPTRRNPLMTLLLPIGVMFGGIVLSVILSLISAPLGGIGSLVTLGGAVWAILIAIRMIAELRAVTRNDALVWWPLIVPLYNMYFMWLIVPQEVAKAKQMLGVRQPPQSIILYVFLWHFALASDLNDMVR